ncbi:tyrosine-type recombinase/integrase [Cryobacterium sp. Y82]|uniref:tyrosine-type recombinase/integrase n=1 Tax=Cryobacterium sp. Y82 TaxID=2045017 RepID=UPI001304A5D7|nr:tyrosine-type recombinase/integrase [Cryobacterium sp. Y82]
MPDFIGFLRENGAGHVTTELAVAWATQPANTSPVWWRQRLGFVRGFAEYLRNIDPDIEVPPRGLLPARYQRIAPYFYSAAEIDSVMEAARSLNPPLRAATYETLIGLLSVTGLRRGEALALNRDDLDLKQLSLVIRQAKGGGRTVPLQETTVRALQRYFDCIDRVFSAPMSPVLFVSIRGTRLNKNSINATFPHLIDTAGLAGWGQRARPRLHDLRHSFAVRQLIDWNEQHVDVDARRPLLSAVLGHSNPESTYWYLQGAPELFTLVGQRLEEFLGKQP